MSQRSIRDGLLTIEDGTAEPLTVTVKIGEGNITWNERRNVDYTRDRGVIAEVRLGDDEAVEVSFDFIWDWISNISGVTIIEALKGTGTSWVSAGDNCEPYACTLVLVIEPDNCAGSQIETITFNEFRWETINPDLRAGQISCTGRCMSYTAA